MKASNVVAFKTDGGISPALVQGLLEKGRTYGLEEIIPFQVADVVIAEWVHLKCRYGCSRYNSNWCCPPATPDADKTRVILNEYSQALLLTGTQRCPDFYRENARKRANQVHYWKGTVSLERMLFLEGYYKAFSLVGECCALCKSCAYPGECRFPQERRPSVESFSIDVIGTLKNLGITAKVATHTSEPYRYYGMILVE